MNNYAEIAKEARIKTLKLVYKAQTSHIGSNFSAIDIMTVLFEKADPEKDECILSAGWKAAAWYYFLWKKGIITEEELDSFCQPNSKFIGLVEPLEERWGLRCAGGSMGFGFPFAVGFALAKKLKGEEGKVYCLMSDGEMAIGTTWESALIAAHHKLDNLVIIVDNNGFQAMGKTQEILQSRFPEIRCIYKETDGHNHEEIENSFVPYEFENGPIVIMANTIKGKGVSFMENNNEFHYRAPNEEEFNLAMKELNV